ncbi:MAG: membrane integrity-associated transporter subunit PqiC [Alphaproteobacteria bacterium]|nr:membrane integrity-associated transporter subunit PqiC [Alphaproteobacteria bacterium]
MKKVLICLLGLMLAGCFAGTTKESRFYALKSEMIAQTTYKTKNISINIDNVRIPAAIDKPQIITIDKNGVELKIHELHRWSEPLNLMIAGTMADDMALYLPNATVKNGGAVFETFTYNISVDVVKFIGNGQKATLDAWWTLRDEDEKQIAAGRFVFSEPTTQNYVDLVTAQSNLISRLAQDISQKIANH